MPGLLAEPDAVSTYMQDYGLNAEAVEQALGYATALIQAATAQHLLYVADDAVVLPCSAAGWTLLPERPVHNVSAVAVRSQTGASDQVVTSGQWSLQAGGRLVLHGLPGTAPGATLAVTYTHGFPVIPLDLQAVTVGVAVRTLHKPHERYNEALESFAAPVSTAGPARLTDIERQICQRYRQISRGVVWQ